MAEGEYAAGSIWFYAPNKGAAIFFTIAFLATGATHLWQVMWVLLLFVFCPFFLVCFLLPRIV
jgi:hypothetical protein